MVGFPEFDEQLVVTTTSLTVTYHVDDFDACFLFRSLVSCLLFILGSADFNIHLACSEEVRVGQNFICGLDESRQESLGSLKDVWLHDGREIGLL